MEEIRILISRPDRIGDVVLSTSLPREIKRKYPKSFVSLLLRNYTKDIYLNNPFVDEIIIIEEYGSHFKLIKKLRSRKFTHSFMLLPTEKINWIFFFAGIKYRIGVGNKFYQFITNTKSVYRNKYIPLRHEADYCLDFLRKIGIKPESISSEIHLSNAETEKRNSIRSDLAVNGEKIIGINSTSGNSAPNILPLEYRKLAEMILKNPAFKLVITDLIPPKELIGIDGAVYLNIDNSLRESIVNFSALDILISSSTGPMHIAGGLGIKTLSLFCPLPACSPQLWSPQGNEAHIILPDEIYCGKICSGDPKNCHFEGNGGIDADKIYEHLIHIFK